MVREGPGCLPSSAPVGTPRQNLDVADRVVQAIVLVTDLEEARRHMEELGFTVHDGGRHPGRGTANLIVPLGQQYLEAYAIAYGMPGELVAYGVGEEDPVFIFTIGREEGIDYDYV